MSEISHRDEKLSKLSMLNESRESLTKARRRGPTSSAFSNPRPAEPTVDIEGFLSSPIAKRPPARMPANMMELSPQRATQRNPALPYTYSQPMYKQQMYAPQPTNQWMPPTRLAAPPTKMYARNNSRLRKSAYGSDLSRYVEKRPIDENQMEVDGSYTTNSQQKHYSPFNKMPVRSTEIQKPLNYRASAMKTNPSSQYYPSQSYS